MYYYYYYYGRSMKALTVVPLTLTVCSCTVWELETMILDLQMLVSIG